MAGEMQRQPSQRDLLLTTQVDPQVEGPVRTIMQKLVRSLKPSCRVHPRVLARLQRLLTNKGFNVAQFAHDGGFKNLLRLIQAGEPDSVVMACNVFQLFLTKYTPFMVFPPDAPPGATLAVATNVLIKVLRSSAHTNATRVAAAACLTRLAGSLEQQERRQRRREQARAMSRRPSVGGGKEGMNLQGVSLQAEVPLWAQEHVGEEEGWHAETAAALLELLLLVGAESTEMAKATERVLRSVIAASCSTEGQIIEIKDLELMVKAINNANQPSCQRAAVQAVSCIAGVQRSNRRGAVKAGVLQALLELAPSIGDATESLGWALAFFAGDEKDAMSLLTLGVVGSLAQLMKLEDAGIKRSMLHAMTVLFKRQPGLFSSAFTANDGVQALMTGMDVEEAKGPDENKAMLASALRLLHDLLALRQDKAAVTRAVLTSGGLPQLVGCAQLMDCPEASIISGRCLQLMVEQQPDLRNQVVDIAEQQGDTSLKSLFPGFAARAVDRMSFGRRRTSRAEQILLARAATRTKSATAEAVLVQQTSRPQSPDLAEERGRSRTRRDRRRGSENLRSPLHSGGSAALHSQETSALHARETIADSDGGKSRGSDFETFSFRERQMRLRTGMNERLLEAERGVPISPPPAALRRAVSAVLQSGQEKVVQRSASRMHERLGPQHTRAEEIRPLPASSRLRDSLKVRAKKLGWAPDRVGTASATSAFHEAGAAPPAPTTPEQESKGGLQVQGSDGGPQTQGSTDFVEDLGMQQPTRMDLDFVAHGSGDEDAKHAVRASDYRLPRSARRPGAQGPQPVHLAPVQQPAQIDRLQRAVDQGAHYQREALKLRQQQLEKGAVVGRRKIGKRQQAAQVAAQHHAEPGSDSDASQQTLLVAQQLRQQQLKRQVLAAERRARDSSVERSRSPPRAGPMQLEPQGVPPQQMVQAEVRLLQRLRQQSSELGAHRMARVNGVRRREGRSVSSGRSRRPDSEVMRGIEQLSAHLGPAAPAPLPAVPNLMRGTSSALPLLTEVHSPDGGAAESDDTPGPSKLDTGGSTRNTRVWKPWVPIPKIGPSSQAPPSLDFKPTQPTDQAQMSIDAASPRLPDADHGMSAVAASHVLPDTDRGMPAYAASHRLPVAEDKVSLPPADSPTSSLGDPASRSPVMVSGVSSAPDSEALYELPGLMASGSDSQPTQAAQPASVTVRHIPAGAAAVSDAAAEADAEPAAAQAPAGRGALPADDTAAGSHDAEAPAGQGAVPTAAWLGPSSMGVGISQAVGTGAGQTGPPAGARLGPAPVDGEAAAGQTAAPAGAKLEPDTVARVEAAAGQTAGPVGTRLEPAAPVPGDSAAGQTTTPAGDPAPVAGHSAAGQTAAPAAGNLQPAAAASAAAGRGKGVGGAASTAQAPMDARQMQLPAKFDPRDNNLPPAGPPVPLAPPQPQPQLIAQLPTPFAQASLQQQPQQQQPADEDLLPSPFPISDLPASVAAAAPVLAQSLKHGGGHSNRPPPAGTDGRGSVAEGTDVPLTPAPSPEVDMGRPAGRRGALRSHRLSEDDWGRRQAEPSAQQAPAGVPELAASSTKRHEGSVAPGAHSRNVSRELRESSEGARSAILLAADDAEAGVTQQGPAEQSAAEHSAAEQNAAEHIAAEQNAAELSAAMLSADPPQLLPALDGMDAGPSSGASGAAQGPQMPGRGPHTRALSRSLSGGSAREAMPQLRSTWASRGQAGAGGTQARAHGYLPPPPRQLPNENVMASPASRVVRQEHRPSESIFGGGDHSWNIMSSGSFRKAGEGGLTPQGSAERPQAGRAPRPRSPGALQSRSVAFQHHAILNGVGTRSAFGSPVVALPGQGQEPGAVRAGGPAPHVLQPAEDESSPAGPAHTVGVLGAGQEVPAPMPGVQAGSRAAPVEPASTHRGQQAGGRVQPEQGARAGDRAVLTAPAPMQGMQAAADPASGTDSGLEHAQREQRLRERGRREQRLREQQRAAAIGAAAAAAAAVQANFTVRQRQQQHQRQQHQEQEQQRLLREVSSNRNSWKRATAPAARSSAPGAMDIDPDAASQPPGDSEGLDVANRHRGAMQSEFYLPEDDLAEELEPAGAVYEAGPESLSFSRWSREQRHAGRPRGGQLPGRASGTDGEGSPRTSQSPADRSLGTPTQDLLPQQQQAREGSAQADLQSQPSDASLAERQHSLGRIRTAVPAVAKGKGHRQRRRISSPTPVAQRSNSAGRASTPRGSGRQEAEIPASGSGLEQAPTPAGSQAAAWATDPAHTSNGTSFRKNSLRENMLSAIQHAQQQQAHPWLQQGAGSPSKARAAAAVGPQPRWGKRAAARPRLSDVDWEAQDAKPAGITTTGPPVPKSVFSSAGDVPKADSRRAAADQTKGRSLAADVSFLDTAGITTTGPSVPKSVFSSAGDVAEAASRRAPADETRDRSPAADASVLDTAASHRSWQGSGVSSRSDFPTAAAAVAAAAEGAHVRSRSAQKAALRRSLSAAPRSTANTSAGAAELAPPSTSPDRRRQLALHSASSAVSTGISWHQQQQQQQAHRSLHGSLNELPQQQRPRALYGSLSDVGRRGSGTTAGTEPRNSRNSLGRFSRHALHEDAALEDFSDDQRDTEGQGEDRGRSVEGARLGSTWSATRTPGRLSRATSRRSVRSTSPGSWRHGASMFSSSSRPGFASALSSGDYGTPRAGITPRSSLLNTAGSGFNPAVYMSGEFGGDAAVIAAQAVAHASQRFRQAASMTPGDMDAHQAMEAAEAEAAGEPVLQWSSRHTVIELAEPDSSTQEVASGVHPAALQNTHHGATHPPGRLKRLGQPSSSELRVQESADESEPSPPVDSSVVRRAVASVQGSQAAPGGAQGDRSSSSVGPVLAARDDSSGSPTAGQVRRGRMGPLGSKIAALQRRFSSATEDGADSSAETQAGSLRSQGSADVKKLRSRWQ